MRFIMKYSYLTAIVSLFFLLSSCLPEQGIRDNLSSAENTTSNSGTDSNSSSDQLSDTTNFIQIGSTKITTTLQLNADYADTFQIRGNDIINLLQQRILSTQQNYCLVSYFPGSLSNNILVFSARISYYFNTTLRTREYFLQIAPNNEIINQGDCLTVSLTNKLTSLYNSNKIVFKASDLCSNCTQSLSSNSLRLFETNGTEEKNANISFLFINITPTSQTNSSSSTAVCVNDANCSAINFDCCLNGQCVNHGEPRSEVDQTSSEFLIAKQLISGNPEVLKDYKHLFYFCPNYVSNNPSDGQTTIDPIQQASDLLQELTKLYNCTTPQIDEFSICTKEYENASLLMSSSAYSFGAEIDDLNFSNIAPTSGQNNIVQIDYAGEILFKEKVLSGDSSVALDPAITLSSANDILTSAQTATIKKSPPLNAINDTVSIYYKVNGTCEKLGSSLARCKKYYIQGQSSSPSKSSDHSAGNQNFALPNYADLSYKVVVDVDSTSIAEGSDTWSLLNRNVTFDALKFPIYSGQKIELTYFVTNNIDQLTKSKSLAQDAINDHCKCDPNKDPCTLRPVTTTLSGTETVTSYSCIYPEPNVPDSPLQQTIYLSAKAVPHKFYDEFGVNTDLGDSSSQNAQEGEQFEYTDGNILKPNNVSKYIGFNEIYGTMNIDGSSPLPPKVVNVEKGKTYDIFIDQGSFSSCLNCGTDYYSGLQKLFPNNFEYKGGGYEPAFYESRRRTNQSKYPADDFRFGRACFVPATMIPWTHTADANITTQRRNRLAAQHFLFANGLNKDWYGFDYGSVIGSFDGVKWFAIGNQRKIKADGNKLYLAVNAYFGDLTINNSFKVTVNEINPVLNSGSLITHDSDSDGASCQKAHFCSTDEDCMTQLGYDYSCINVSLLETPWPTFDSNGNEISGSLNKTLLSIVGGNNGQSKRCVYRGQGAICEQKNQSLNISTSYTNSDNIALHSCSNNTFCANLSQNEFNTKIARYADSAANQNLQSYVTTKTDTFGLGTRVLGRPYNFYGTEVTPVNVRIKLNENKVKAICAPGKDPENSNTLEELNYLSGTSKSADKISNIGRTISSVISQDENYFAACPATDSNGNYTHLQNESLNSSLHNPYAIRNNLSTNSLDLPVLSNSALFNDSGTLISKMGYQKNTCLRAPGAKCFSDFECAPNEFIASKFKSISNFNGQISTAEENFWEEELVCANSQERFQENSIYPNPLYDTTTHRCCRETNKSFTFTSQPHENSDFDVIDSSGNPLIPGVNQDINDPRRYSRTHTIYDKLITDKNTYPPLVSAAPRPTSPLLLNLSNIRQYNTLHLHNERMCCTGHWVRKFASGSNSVNGGTKFSGTTQQNIPISTFTALAFAPNNIPAINAFPSTDGYKPHELPFTCTPSDYQTSDCEVRNIAEGSSFEQKYLDWFSKFELVGIPQVIIETNSTIEKPVSTPKGGSPFISIEEIDEDGDGTALTVITESPTGSGVYVRSNNDISIPQLDISQYKLPMDNTIKDEANGGVVDAIFNGINYYSAASYDNLEIGTGKLKKIFSEDEFNCCIPTGYQVDANTPASTCCTGTINQVDNVTRCCLDDFTDLSVYTNRYVSSEGAYFNGQKINDNDIDPETGYIKKEIVAQMAATMCCSGKATFGKVINDYLIPINFDEAAANCPKTRRFAFLENLDDSVQSAGGVSKYNAGLKWNNHVYCVPSDFTEEVSSTGCTGTTGGSSTSGGSGSVSN